MIIKYVKTVIYVKEDVELILEDLIICMKWIYVNNVKSKLYYLVNIKVKSLNKFYKMIKVIVNGC